MPLEQGLGSRLIRVCGFFAKEVLSVLRQPRLIMTLVIGPFLILLLFGLGFRSNPPEFRTVLVLGSEEAGLAAGVDELRDSFAAGMDLESTTTDRDSAEDRLTRGDVDLLIIAPEDPLGSLDRGEKAVFTVVHREIDPVVRSSITLRASLAVDEINRRVLAAIVDSAQERSETVETPLTVARQGAGALVAALERNDRQAADAEITALRAELEGAQTGSVLGSDLFTTVAEALGTYGDDGASLDELMDQSRSADNADALRSARELEATLAEMDNRLAQAQDVDPRLLVSPFKSEVREMTDAPTLPAIFYAPGTLILLVQHLTITFAALALVRERELGMTEVLRVSPLRPVEAQIGRYLGFLVLAGSVAAILTLTMLAFGVPMRGSTWQYVVIVTLVILASLGLGFLLSGLAKTDSQAVQYSMMVLLISIFFTGFVLSLDQLAAPVRALSYLIPTTYGISSLQDIMFRGVDLEPLMAIGLAGYVLVLGFGAWWAGRRDIVAGEG